MGALTLPESGRVYLDANGFIYTVESEGIGQCS